MNRIPLSKRDPAAPYFGSDKPYPGKRVCKVIPQMLPCCCRQRVVFTSMAFGDALLLNYAPVADGAYVVVENAFGGQGTAEYDETLHAGWPRYAAHVCPGKVA